MWTCGFFNKKAYRYLKLHINFISTSKSHSSCMKTNVTVKCFSVTLKCETAETFQLASETHMMKRMKLLVEFQLNIGVLSLLK